MISHPKKPDWGTLFLLFGMYLLLAANIYLYEYHRLSGILHILISASAIHLAFTIWHEAAHGNTAKGFLGNSIVGILGIFPYMAPYFISRHIHLAHHVKLNQKDDPNYIYTDGPFWQIPFRYFRAIFYMKDMLQKSRDPRKDFERRSDMISTGLVLAIYAAAIVSGRFKEILLLWTIPFLCAKILMDYYINYLPHVGLPPDKYKGTRVIDLQWFTPLVLFHNYHAIHHLWPQQPWHYYYQIFKERKDDLIKNGVPVEHHLYSLNFRSAAEIV